MLVSVFSIQLRYSAAVFGFLPVPQANAYEHEGAASQARVDGPITVSVDYTSEVVAGNDRMNPSGLTSTQTTMRGCVPIPIPTIMILRRRARC